MTSDSIGRIVVVGAGVSGMRTAQALRHRGYDGTLTLVGAETHAPYDRPPLTKEYLVDEVDKDEIAVCEPEEFDDLDIELRLGTRAIGIDTGARTVALTNDEQVTFDRLIVATGADPIIPHAFRDRSDVTRLHTIEDVAVLRDRLAAGSRVAVIGGGFIGAEIASSVRQMGYDVVLIEAFDFPMQRVLGAEVGSVLGANLVRHGVELHTGSPASALLGNGAVEAIELADGRRIDADHVVIALGVRPDCRWLDGCGLELSDGIQCTASGAAVGSGGLVHAAGDVARWFYPGYDEYLRVEHWTTAVEMAPIVARSVLGAAGPERFLGAPYFWSDQCGIKIQFLGRIDVRDQLQVLIGDLVAGEFLAVYHCADRVTGALAMGMGAAFVAVRRSVEQRWTIDEVRRLLAESAVLR